jgi:amidase
MHDDTPPWRMSAVAVADAVRARRLTARAVTESVLDRLAEVNPSINAVVREMPSEALAAADRVDRALAAGDDPGPMAGVPVTIKVNVDQAGHATTNGLRLQETMIAAEDSPLVANLRKSGAVIVGRTNMPAFGLRWFTRCALHGHTRNPRNPDLTPGGSSGGAGAAVASGIGAIGHGTDIGGSIRYPAYACGVHGIRPTFGRIPAVNFSAPDRLIGAQLMAVSGPIARTIGDLRLSFDAMSQRDIRDSWHVAQPAIPASTPKRAALAAAPEDMEVAPEIVDTLRAAAEVLRAAGWTVEERSCPPLREAAEIQAILWLADFRHNVVPVLKKERDPDSVFVFEQMERLSPDGGLRALMDALQRRAALIRSWQTFLEEYPILLLPVSGEPPFPDLLDVESSAAFDRVIAAQLTQLALPLIGVPCMAVTTRLEGATPLGVQLVAPRYREDLLFDVGEIIEAAGTPTSPIDPVIR